MRKLLQTSALVLIAFLSTADAELPMPYRFPPGHTPSAQFQPQIESTIEKAQEVFAPDELYAEAWKSWPVEALDYLVSLLNVVPPTEFNPRNRIYWAIAASPFPGACEEIENEIRKLTGESGPDAETHLYNLAVLYNNAHPAEAFRFYSELALSPVSQSLRRTGHDGIFKSMSVCGRTLDEMNAVLAVVEEASLRYPEDNEAQNRRAALENARGYPRAMEAWSRRLPAAKDWQATIPEYLRNDDSSIVGSAQALGRLARDSESSMETRREAITALVYSHTDLEILREWKGIKKALCKEQGIPIPKPGRTHAERMLQTFEILYPETTQGYSRNCFSRTPWVSKDYAGGIIWPYTYFRRVGDEWLIAKIEAPAIP